MKPRAPAWNIADMRDAIPFVDTHPGGADARPRSNCGRCIVDFVGKLDDLDDKQLFAAWKGGDKQAGSALIARHHASVTRFFAHRLGPDSDDLVQQTFLGLLEGLDRLHDDTSFRAFLFGVARNKLLRNLRDRVRDRDRFDPGETSIADIDPSPTALMAVKDQHKLLLAALRRLPVDQQIMLELHYWEKLKIKDIAAALGMNINTVKTQMKRGRERLNTVMAELAESKQQLETTLDGLEQWAVRLRKDVDV